MSLYEEAWESLENQFKRGMHIKPDCARTALGEMAFCLKEARRKAVIYQEKLKKEMEKGYKEMAEELEKDEAEAMARIAKAGKSYEIWDKKHNRWVEERRIK